MSDKLLMTFEAEPPNGPHEGDFRRGYHQGAHAMVEAIRGGLSIDQLEAFIEGELREWRHSPSTPAFPPAPDKNAVVFDDERMIEVVAELNRGAAMMKDAGSEQEELKGARIITRAGQRLVDAGGVDLLRKACSHVAPEVQRRVELQWFGLTDADGNQWLP